MKKMIALNAVSSILFAISAVIAADQANWILSLLFMTGALVWFVAACVLFNRYKMSKTGY